MIAIDQGGHVAVGTSTNGLTHKVPGYEELATGTKNRNVSVNLCKIVLTLDSCVQHDNYRFTNACL